MFKRLIASMLIVLSLSSVSFGRVRDFGSFTIDIPTGWVMDKNTGGADVIKKTDGSGMIVIGTLNTEGNDAESVIRDYANRLNTTEPRYEDGAYHFMRHEDGKDIRVMAIPFEEYELILIAAWSGISKSQVVKIIGSIEFK